MFVPGFQLRTLNVAVCADQTLNDLAKAVQSSRLNHLQTFTLTMLRTCTWTAVLPLGNALSALPNLRTLSVSLPAWYERWIANQAFNEQTWTLPALRSLKFSLTDGYVLGLRSFPRINAPKLERIDVDGHHAVFEPLVFTVLQSPKLEVMAFHVDTDNMVDGPDEPFPESIVAAARLKESFQAGCWPLLRELSITSSIVKLPGFLEAVCAKPRPLISFGAFLSPIPESREVRALLACHPQLTSCCVQANEHWARARSDSKADHETDAEQKQLTVAHLKRLFLTSITDAFFRNITFQALEEVTLGAHVVLHSISSVLRACPALTNLHISECKIGDWIPNSFANSVLKLHCAIPSSVGGDPLMMRMFLDRFPKLKHFEILSPHVTPTGLQALCECIESAWMPDLEVLDLYRAPKMALSALKKLLLSVPNLTMIRLPSTTDKWVRLALAKWQLKMVAQGSLKHKSLECMPADLLRLPL